MIDILQIGNSDKVFFADPKASTQVATNLAKFLKSVPSSAKPVIRYLISQPSKQHPQDDGFVQALFEATAGQQVDVQIFYGNLMPNFAFSDAPQNPRELHLANAVGSIWQWLLDELRKHFPAVYDALVKIETDVKAWLLAFAGILAKESPSFNHIKVFAINGKQLVTGGANCFFLYATHDKDNKKTTWLFDLSMRLDGDAAIDAHNVANYLWEYLHNRPKTDTFSQSEANNLKNDINNFRPANPMPFDGFAPNGGSTHVLTVGKNGLWTRLGLSFQVVDGIRDFLINVLAVFAEAKLGGDASLVAFAVNALGDDSTDFQKVLNLIGINPAAWASRHARNYALGQSQKVVRFSQQKFVMDDLIADKIPGYQALVDKINATFNARWNGFIWPFDTLSALGRALSNMSDGRPAEGIQIVCSYWKPGEREGYEDAITTNEFKNALTQIMLGMKALRYIQPVGDVSEIVDKLVSYRTIDATHYISEVPLHANHSKLVVIDDAVCYVGADNAYSSYNEEFGVWIDDSTAISSFVVDYWNSLWASFSGLVLAYSKPEETLSAKSSTPSYCHLYLRLALDGKTFGEENFVGTDSDHRDTTDIGMCTTMFNNLLCFCWVGPKDQDNPDNGPNWLNVLQGRFDPFGTRRFTFSGKQTFKDFPRSVSPPSATVFERRLYVAWTAVRSGNINIISSDDGSKFISTPTRLEVASNSAPSLLSFNGHLRLV